MKPGQLLRTKNRTLFYPGRAKGHFITGLHTTTEVVIPTGEVCVFLGSCRGSKNFGMACDLYTVLCRGQVMFSEHFNFERIRDES